MVDHDVLQDIESFIKGEFPAGEIRSVTLVNEFEDSGDRVLVFKIAFDGPVGDMIENAPLGLSRCVLDRLRASAVDGFPFLDFVPAAGALI